MRTLSHAKAKKFYDRFGARQDSSTLYEDLPIKLLIENSEFDNADSILEFGCGTGKLANRLLADHISPAAKYTALDISDTMINLVSAVSNKKGEGEFSHFREEPGTADHGWSQGRSIIIP